MALGINVDTTTLEQLLSPLGQAALSEVREWPGDEAKFPAYVDRLRKQYPERLARAVIETHFLRLRARDKFQHPERMYFDREALEMASGQAVARYRAQRFRGYSAVADLCCGIGADSLALAEAGCHVLAVEINPIRLRMAQANFASFGYPGRFFCSDLRCWRPPIPVDAVFADPGRRPGGKRVLSIHQYEPPVPAILEQSHGFEPMPKCVALKVAPGVPAREWKAFPGEVEFISDRGELKECVFWWRPGDSHAVRATMLPEPVSLTAEAGSPVDEVKPPGRYLYDPDPSVTRSGLVGVLGGLLGAWLIEPGIAILSSDQHSPTRWATVYSVEEILPAQPKKLGQWLKSRGIGSVTVVKRGSSIDAEELVHSWTLRGELHRTVVLTKIGGRNQAIVGCRIATDSFQEFTSQNREA